MLQCYLLECGRGTPFSCHMLWLSLCSLLLLADCLSAVPHHSTAAGPPSIELQATFTCTSDFILHESHCYRYFGAESRRAFYHAEKMCAHFHSSLVSLLNREEESFVVQLADNNTAFWIGLNDEEGPSSTHTEGVFKWTSGEEYSGERYRNWRTGEPNNRRHLDCVKADSSGWAMATGGCASSKLPFVCKKRACPPGLDWDGVSCDIILIPQDHTPTDLSNWSNLLTGHRTLVLMLLVSLLVAAISLTVKTRGTAAKSKWPPMSASSRQDPECRTTTGTHRTKLLSRIDDLLPPT